jgi:ketosteroid isomerase-like protein
MVKREPFEVLAKKVFDAMNFQNFESLKPVLTDDIVFHFPGTPPLEGSRRVILFLNALMRKYKNLTFEVSEVIIDATENMACVVWTNSGLQLNGMKYQNSGITLIKFRDGKICLLSDYFKDTSFVTLN